MTVQRSVDTQYSSIEEAVYCFCYNNDSFIHHILEFNSSGLSFSEFCKFFMNMSAVTWLSTSTFINLNDYFSHLKFDCRAMLGHSSCTTTFWCTRWERTLPQHPYGIFTQELYTYPIYSNPKLYIFKNSKFSFRTAVQLTHRLSSMQMVKMIKFDSKSKCLDLKDKTKEMSGFTVLFVSVVINAKK